MAFSDDPLNQRRFGTADEIYAIGAVIVAWNLCEGVLEMLIRRVVKLDWKTARLVFNMLGNSSRQDLLRLEASARLTEEEIQRVENFLSAYSICLENRNLIAHSQIGMNAVEGGLNLTKASGRGRLSPNRYTVPTATMIEVATTTHSLAQWGFSLQMAIWAGPSRMLTSGGKPFPAPLPDKFPRPNKLSPRAPEDR
ncbi:MAG: hypothetical protein MEP57_03760 [Microvirga sp.]|nr:hypothetical protein [Microvirga sp.]